MINEIASYATILSTVIVIILYLRQNKKLGILFLIVLILGIAIIMLQNAWTILWAIIQFISLKIVYYRQGILSVIFLVFLSYIFQRLRKMEEAGKALEVLEKKSLDLEPTRVLIHGTYCSSLRKILYDPSTLRIDITPDWQDLGKLSSYSVLILVSASIPDERIGLEIQEHIRNFVQEGGGLVAMHDTLYPYNRNNDTQRNGEIVKLVGVEGMYHSIVSPQGEIAAAYPGKWDIEINQKYAGHFICKGFDSFRVEDEIIVLRAERAVQDLFSTEVRDNLPNIPSEQIGQNLSVGGCREVEKGRIFYWVFGHDEGSFLKGETTRILKRALSWVARR